MALYGNDIDDKHTVLEADLGWIVKFEKGDFIGRTALHEQQAAGLTRKLVGFVPKEKRVIPRHGFDVFLKEHKVDVVRSGGFSPSLGHGIGTTYLPTHSIDPGTTFEFEARGKRMEAEVIKLPFYTQGSVKRG